MRSSCCVFSATCVVMMIGRATADPSLLVFDIGLNGSGNREWRVEVAPDPKLFEATIEGFGGSLAIELAFDITGSELLGASFNAIDWPYDIPGNNPFTATVTQGAVLDLAGDTLFASLGSDLFTSGSPSEVFTFETSDTGFTTVSWGGHTIDGYTGCRIAQAGVKFDGYQGSLSEPLPPPGSSLQFVRDHPFVVSGVMDRTALSNSDATTYLDTWNATTGDNFNSSNHVLNEWEPRGTQWTMWVSPGSEGIDGMFDGVELGRDNSLSAGLPSRYGYHIGGEPKTQAETDEVIATAAALKQYDPGGFVYVGLNTDATDAMEDQMMSNPNIDGVIGHRYHGNNTSYENLRHTRDLGLQHNKPYFRFLRSFKSRPDAAEPYDLTDSDYRFSAFSSLTYGYTGIQWFIYNLEEVHNLDSQLFTATETYQFSDRKSPAFENVAALNQELFYIGEQTKHLRSTDVRLHLGDDAPYGQPTGTADWSAGAGGDPYITSVDQFVNDDMDILIGFFEHLDTQDLYFMVQNTLHTHGDNSPAIIDGVVEIAFDFSSVVDPLFEKTSIEKMSRLTGLWETIPLTPDGDDLYHFEYLLAGGDADLFRYSISTGTSGDFDGDGDVDGHDFLLWQRGGSPNPLSQSDLADWEANYGTASPIVATSTAVPEPCAGVMLLLGVMTLFCRSKAIVSHPIYYSAM